MQLKTKILSLTLIFIAFPLLMISQVKVGDNPSLINSNSILELESNSKVLVITRLNESEINALTPLEGALVYNTDAQCVFAFDGLIWKNLCDEPNISVSATGPLNNKIGDFWFNNATNLVSIWNGSQWLPININPRRGSGAPNTSIVNPLAGDIYVDQNTGEIYSYNGSVWVSVNKDVNANNGISINSNTLQLGGALITPTVITTNALNTLAIEGLQDVNFSNSSNSIVVVDNTSGVLKKVSTSNLVRQQQVIVMANNGQSQFTTPSEFTVVDELEVYRNGARITFARVNSTTIEVEPEATCYDGDEIRIVQLKLNPINSN
ncbi:hypothetical protein FPF71_07110 [Algibacter amylolyticus]|uniref:Uncharacterized protein n=1 Tax=Algibacter amylolyticus TaxID=1608400 RepID=A0A5M7B8F0_9FLAO|nr:hypothetical protein [Algibacter amylolyticus]KAA5825672.1 hypothetical protein F2B50_07110 [Algibacter amylolyticus]MBB5268098.1 hypothetical protein [Algibacter amylolyticus]TSJ79970.1 hypothetical protein FPF71_07110 [Algibacter amylolyticus]